MARGELILVTVLCAVAVSVPMVLCENVTTQIDENEMGMEVYFDIVKGFLGDVVQRKNISESFLNLSTVFVDGNVDEDSLTDWGKWADYLVGYMVCGCLGLLFIVVMPLTGLIFCCCRLCGKCGARPKERESKRATCKRGSYCTILLILNTFVLGGAVCGLVCISLLQEHMQNENGQGTVGHMQGGLQEVERFVDNSVQDISTYVRQEFDTISGTILRQVNDSGQNAVDEVLDLLNATSLLAEADSVSKEALAIKEELDKVQVLLTELTEDTNTLSQNLTDIRLDVERVCDSPSKCPGFNADEYSVQSNFTDLKKLEDEASKVGGALNMSEYVRQAEESIDNAKSEATKNVEEETNRANSAIKDVRVEIDNGLQDLETQKNDATKDLKKFQKDLTDSEDDIKEYSDYVYYAGIGICSALLLIILLYYIGVLYGLCGERPGHGAPCCNTGTGANFLMAGVAFTFIFTWLLMIVCVILFVVGGPAYTEVCRYFDGHDPSKFKVFDDTLTNGLDISDFYPNAPPDLSLVQTVQDCQKNVAVFSAMDLNYIVDLDEILSIEELDDRIAELKSTPINIPDIDILNDDLRKDLGALADSGLESIPFQEYFDQLNKDLTGAPLQELASNLDTLGNAMNDPADKQTLLNSAARLRELHSSSVVHISSKMVELNTTMTELEEQSTLKDSIKNLIDHLDNSQTAFNTRGNELVKQSISRLADSISNYTHASVDNVKNEIRTNMLGCRALSNALYTISDSVCILVVRPLNGFWFSLGWCLIFCIPCLVLAVLLASQYRREHQYIKDFEEPNYLMYGGPNPDTIPLTRLMEEQRLRGPGPSGSGMGHHGYAYPGESNPGYSHDKPPPYEDYHRYHMYGQGQQPHYGGQHHDLAAEYPGLYDQPGHLARPHLPPHHGGSSSHTYAYPY